MMEFSSVLRSTASEQHGVLSRTQLARYGIAATELSRWKTRGWLIPFGTNVFRVAGSPVTDAMRLRAALLDAGPTAALSHRTAADLHWFGEGLNRQPAMSAASTVAVSARSVNTASAPRPASASCP